MLLCHTNISIREGGEAMEQESKWIRDIQRSGSRQAAERLVEWYRGTLREVQIEVQTVV